MEEHRYKPGWMPSDTSKKIKSEFKDTGKIGIYIELASVINSILIDEHIDYAVKNTSERIATLLLDKFDIKFKESE